MSSTRVSLPYLELILIRMKTLYTKSLFSLFLLTTLILGPALAQNSPGTVSGMLRTSDGKPAADVSVALKNTNRNTMTEEDGSFSIKNIKPGRYQIRIVGMGITTQEHDINVTSGQTLKLEYSISANASELSEVNVMGYKTPNQKPVNLGKISIPPRDLPQAVQIIGAQVIADQQANRLSDVLKNVNGVAFGENRGGVSGETFFARGYSLGTNNVFKNGVRANSGGMPEVASLESVEVLKGSAALLYGGVSGGAVVNMVTKKPKFNYGGEVSMRAGSYDFYKPTVDLYGPISSNLAFRVIGSLEDAGSYRDNVTSKRTYINPSLLYKVGKNTEILLQGDYLKSDYTPDFGIGSVNNKIVDLGRSTFLGTDWAYNKTTTTTAQLGITHKFSENWKLNVLGSLQAYKRDYFSSERPAADVNGFWNRALTRSNQKEYTYNQQINLNGAFNTGFIGHTLLVGMDADQSNVTSYGYNNPNNLSVPVTNAKYYDRVNILDRSSFGIPTNFNMPDTYQISDTYTPIYRMGGFVQDLLTLTEKFKVLAGLRYSFQKTPRSVLSNYQTGTETLVSNGIDKSKTESALSPKLGLIYQPLKTTSVYVSYSNNFTSNSGIDIATNAPMAPSTIDQYEAGIKNDFLNGRLSANLTWYRILNNKYAQTAEADATKKEFNGKSASDGLEIDLSGTIVEGLNFLAGYSYNYMRYTSTIATGVLEGQRLVGTTKNTANATLFYTVRNGKIRGVKFGASAFYTGDRNGGYNDRKDGSASRLIPLSAFTTFDVSAGYSWKKLSILAKLANITNELNYFVHENYSVNPIPPRQFMTTVSYRF
jgi:iron complex outermembrane receptor protein